MEKCYTFKKVNVEIIFEKVCGFQPTCQQMFFIF